MTPTRPSTLALTGLVCAIVAWLLLRVTYAALPPLPWTPVPALGVLAVAETWSGRSVRMRLRGQGSGHPIQPIAVARMAALAKASSLAAAIIGGLAAGFLIYVVGSLGKSAFRADAYSSAGTLAASAALIAAALYLEHGCRSRPPGDLRDEDPRRGRDRNDTL
jgi:uncharacterized protein DUF3180